MRCPVIFCFFLAFGLSAVLKTAAQDSLSVARLKSIKGSSGTFSGFAKKDSLFLICFWSSNSDESIAALNTLNGELEKWQAAVPFRFMAVCVDEGKLANR
ncbi:MAG TPA: hypothetical protein VG890_06795, partial [Puia sp.]|nr:hypothetical protein [Puia sp.]